MSRPNTRTIQEWEKAFGITLHDYIGFGIAVPTFVVELTEEEFIQGALKCSFTAYTNKWKSVDALAREVFSYDGSTTYTYKHAPKTDKD